MKRISQRKDTRMEFRAEKRALSKAIGVGLRVGGTAVLLSMSSQVLSQFGAVVELSDLDGSDGFVLNGSDSFDNSGESVSSAGDVNGDGVADLLIGARTFDNSFAGTSYVVFGDPDLGAMGSVELSALNGTNGFVLNGVDSYDNSGRSVSSAGDVNGDGVADLLIGAYRADPNGNTYAGESYVVFGGKGLGAMASVELSDLDGSDGFVLNGVDSYDYSGNSVSSAGDVNGDGVADLLIGAFVAGPNRSGSGESYVVFGGDVGSLGEIELSGLDGSDGFVLNGVDSGDSAGSSVSSAGDVNDDGVADLLIGAFGADPNGNGSAGKSYVVFGGTGLGALGSVELSDLDGSDGFVLNGVDSSDFSGNSVSSAGDVNGDGVADLLIGAYVADPNGNIDAGESYVVFGGPGIGTGGSVELSGLDGSNGFVLNGVDSGDFAGGSLSGAGDVNGDGVADLLIGADRASPNGNSSAGESYVVFGGSGVGTGGSVELSDLDGNDGFVINGIDVDDFSGESVSSAGDVNGDGIADLVIGASGADPNGNNNAGASYVVFGMAPVVQCNGLSVTVDLNLNESPTAGDDVILGTPDADTINALGGNDTICGEGGDDIINAGTGNDWIDGGAGDDVIRGNGGNDTIFGGVGNDEIRGGGGVDDISGEDGDDTLLGQGGNDTIDGGDGVDSINGGGGRDTLFTGSGATVGTGVFVFGGSGLDTIEGGPDADDLRGGNGNDIINGFGGNDVIAGGLGLDTIDGGDGADTISGGNARDTLSGGPGNDAIDGGSQSDILNGGGGSDTLTGGAGDDELNGDSGADTLSGGAGDDDLDGGATAGDVCNGNLGTDTATAACEVINSVP